LDRRRRWRGRRRLRWRCVLARRDGLLLCRRRFGGFFLGRILRVHRHGADGQQRAENGATGDLA
jgi:hypothetical protein